MRRVFFVRNCYSNNTNRLFQNKNKLKVLKCKTYVVPVEFNKFEKIRYFFYCNYFQDQFCQEKEEVLQDLHDDGQDSDAAPD